MNTRGNQHNDDQCAEDFLVHPAANDQPDRAEVTVLDGFHVTSTDPWVLTSPQEKYSNLRTFYQAYGHFRVGTGPYVLTGLSQAGKTATLSYNPNYLDPSDKWDGYYGP